MRAVVQRVSQARVIIDGDIVGAISDGLLVLLAVAETDSDETIKWFCNKLVNLRIFPDENDKMNRSVTDIGGGLLVISNFTLYGDVQKGFRPNFMRAAPPSFSEGIYERTLQYLRENYSLKIEAGRFGAMMDIESVNCGPVTVIIEKD